MDTYVNLVAIKIIYQRLYEVISPIKSGITYMPMLILAYFFRVTTTVGNIKSMLYSCGECGPLDNCKECKSDLCNGALSKASYTLPLVLVAAYLFY